MTDKCSTDTHASIKADPERLVRETISIGQTTFDHEGIRYHQEWRNCLKCKSTLLIEVEESLESLE